MHVLLQHFFKKKIKSLSKVHLILGEFYSEAYIS